MRSLKLRKLDCEVAEACESSTIGMSVSMEGAFSAPRKRFYRAQELLLSSISLVGSDLEQLQSVFLFGHRHFLVRRQLVRGYCRPMKRLCSILPRLYLQQVLASLSPFRIALRQLVLLRPRSLTLCWHFGLQWRSWTAETFASSSEDIAGR